MNQSPFSMTGETVVITGGAGMLGLQHAAAVAAFGAHPVLLDINADGIAANLGQLFVEFGTRFTGHVADVTSEASLRDVAQKILKQLGRVDVLINNAARNPKIEDSSGPNFSRLEDFPDLQWQLDLEVGLGGAFRCAKVFGAQMAEDGKGGAIVNIASDLGVIAPDQRLYRVEGKDPHEQPVKPVTYSVVKHGLIGLTKYLATYWNEQGIRCNALSPGGVYAGQNDVFVSNLVKLIPMGRMAQPDEYRGAIAFLCSDASKYLNGANLVMDGGRSVW
jgi:NAD(P)-dependent dehydrogenase (short-subunit alcohol dehydrogenase family)